MLRGSFMMQRAFFEAERAECHSEAAFGDKHPVQFLFNDATNTREKHTMKCGYIK